MSTLTNREIVRRINQWAKKAKANAPVCYHNESHGRLGAILFDDEPILFCTKCGFKLLPDNLPKAAFSKS